MIRIKRGLDLPISGAPEQAIGNIQAARSVALLGRDYVGMKPTMAVKVGDRVKLGETLFTDKKNPKIRYVAPGAGVVSAINRGQKRMLLSVVIDLDGDEQLEFNQYPAKDLAGLPRKAVVEGLLTSGLWTALRTRPFSKVADPDKKPRSAFINAMDSNPLAADPQLLLENNMQDFVAGVNLIARLPEFKLYLCLGDRDRSGAATQKYNRNVEVQQFIGPHPAGLAGTHIHYLDPAGPGREVWTINYQDVIAVGKLFATGRLSVERVISMAGPQVSQPRIVKTRLGANLDEMLAGELKPHESRIVSGSVLGGRNAKGAEAYLGRYHLQVSVLREGRERPLLGYLSPGKNRHSVMGIYVSGLFRDRKHAMSTSTQGSARAMVPIGAYEHIMPLDILPTQLLRALIVGDLESAQNLGALELDEEDLALCSYVCPGKYEYGPMLRDNLTRIEKES